MSYASHTDIVAVLSRTEITRRRAFIHLVKVSFLEEVEIEVKEELEEGNEPVENYDIDVDESVSGGYFSGRFGSSSQSLERDLNQFNK